jgi:hypothetical protein
MVATVTPLERAASSPSGRQATGPQAGRPGSLEREQGRPGLLQSGSAGLATTATLLTLLLPSLPGGVDVARAQTWKVCSFNGETLPCLDRHGPDGSVHIRWGDGKALTYRLIRAGFPISTLRDSLGGLWEREILPQGNAVFVNRANGNRIVVPLR